MGIILPTWAGCAKHLIFYKTTRGVFCTKMSYMKTLPLLDGTKVIVIDEGWLYSFINYVV